MKIKKNKFGDIWGLSIFNMINMWTEIEKLCGFLDPTDLVKIEVYRSQKKYVAKNAPLR